MGLSPWGGKHRKWCSGYCSGFLLLLLLLQMTPWQQAQPQALPGTVHRVGQGLVGLVLRAGSRSEIKVSPVGGARGAGLFAFFPGASASPVRRPRAAAQALPGGGAGRGRPRRAGWAASGAPSARDRPPPLHVHRPASRFSLGAGTELRAGQGPGQREGRSGGGAHSRGHPRAGSGVADRVPFGGSGRRGCRAALNPGRAQLPGSPLAPEDQAELGWGGLAEPPRPRTRIPGRRCSCRSRCPEGLPVPTRSGWQWPRGQCGGPGDSQV